MMYPDYEVQNISCYKDLLKIMLYEHGSAIAFSAPEKDWSYRAFSETILSLAAGISMAGVSRLRINISDDVYFAAAYMAVILAGKVAVLSEGHLPPDAQTGVLDDFNLHTFLRTPPCSIHALPDTDPNGVCTILHSSGTSSAPKGIMLSQKNICTDVVCGLQKYFMAKNDRFIHLIPYYHAFGIVCDLLGPLLVGASIYILQDKKQFLSQMSRIKPTILNVPPVIADTLLQLIRQTGSAERLTGGCLKKMLCGGAGLSIQTAQGLRAYGISAYGCYGLSECSPCVAVNRDEWYKDGSAGIPLSCSKVQIAADGEILISGSNVMLGYYNDPEGTDRVLQNGILHTGDLGYLDEDGFLFITGRKSNLIVFPDGTKCSPELLEAQIVSNTPAEEAVISPSRQASRSSLDAVICLKDPTKQAGVEQYIREHLSTFQFDHITFTAEPLPKNPTGKIRRTL